MCIRIFIPFNMKSLVADVVSVPWECRAECGNNLQQDHFVPYHVDFGFLQQSFFFIICFQFSELSLTRHTVLTRIRAAALIEFFAPQVRRLFKHCIRQVYFFYIFIQRYTSYLLIFLWTDTNLIINLELREKFTRWKKKTREFHDNESENISGDSIGGEALIRGRRLLTFLAEMWRLFEGGAYSSKYDTYLTDLLQP